MQKTRAYRCGVLHAVFFVVLLCLVAMARTSPALDQASAAREREESEIRFQRGVELVKAEDYAAALEEFQTSYRLHPRLSVLYNIGMCYKALYRYVEAIGAFERFLSTPNEPIPPQMKQEAVSAIRVMKKLVGVLHLAEMTEGSAVYINGERVAVPKPPRLILNPGNHNLEISKEGFETIRTDINIASDAELTVRAVLSPLESPGEHSAAKNNDEPESLTGNESSSLPPATQEVTNTRWSPRLITGLALALASAGGFVTGGYFVEELRRDRSAAGEVKDKHDTSPDLQTRALLAERYQDLEEELNRDKAFMIVGFSAGAAALAAGIILIVTDVIEKAKTKNSGVAFHPSPGGFTLSF